MGTPRLPKGHFRPGREGRRPERPPAAPALRGHRPLTAPAAKAPRRARLPEWPPGVTNLGGGGSSRCTPTTSPPHALAKPQQSLEGAPRVRGNQKAPCAAAPPNSYPWPRGSGRATPRADNTEQLAQSSRHTARWVLKAERPTHWGQRPRSTLGVRTRPGSFPWLREACCLGPGPSSRPLQARRVPPGTGENGAPPPGLREWGSWARGED